MRLSVATVCGLAFLLFAAAAPARALLFSSAPPPSTDPTSGVLPSYNDVYTNWKNAGLLNSPDGSISTIDAGRAACTTTQAGETMPLQPSGLTPPVAGDDAANINSAIVNCPAGSIVQLAAGTFQIDQSEYIWLRKSETLRGTGNCTNAASPYCQTVINVYNGAIADWTISSATGGNNCGVTSASTSVCTEATGVIYVSPSALYNAAWAGCYSSTSPPTGCGTTLVADAAQGQTTVEVASTANFSVGMWVLIDEDPQVVSTANPTGGANVEASSDWLSTSGAPATMRLEGGDEPGTYSFYPNRLNAEIHRIAAINASGVNGCAAPAGDGCLTFDDPLVLAFRQSGNHDAQVYWPTVQGPGANPFLQEAGVENLTITKAANSGITMIFCAYCWVKGVEVGGWIAGAVNITDSVRDQIEFNYFHDCDDCENNGNEYSIGINGDSTESYIDNNIIVRGGKGMVGRGANTAVVAYNYVDDTFYMADVIGDYWVDMGVNGSHYAGTHDFLFEGNWGDNCGSDETHGNAIYHTFFRNDCTGIRSTFVDPSNGATVNDSAGTGYSAGPSFTGTISGNTLTVSGVSGTIAVNQVVSGVGVAPNTVITGGSGTSWTVSGAAQSVGPVTMLGNVPTSPAPLRAAGPMAFDYWFAYVGNVLGLSGVTTAAHGWSYSGTAGGDIWMSGWTGSDWGNKPDPNLDGTNSIQFIFRHGNFDYVGGGPAGCSTLGAGELCWNADLADRTLPDSFYLSSEPDFFSTVGTTGCVYPWPWVTPTAASPLQSPTGAGCTADSGLPAKARFDAGTPFVQP